MRKSTRMLTEGAVMVALAQILAYVKLFGDLPNGGSITFAAVPIILYAVRWGIGPGLLAGFALWYGLTSFLEQEKNYLLARIGTGLSAVLLLYWLAVIFAGIRG